MRLDIRRIGALKDGEQVIGNRTRVKVVKNKLAPPFQSSSSTSSSARGSAATGDVARPRRRRRASSRRSGAWYSYNGERIGQGRDNARNFLEEHPEMLADIEGQILERHGLRRAGAAGEAAGEAAAEGEDTSSAADAKGTSNGKSSRSSRAQA